MVLVLNWPFLTIPFSMGIYASLVYLFVLWSAVILALFVVARRLAPGDGPERGGDER